MSKNPAPRFLDGLKAMGSRTSLLIATGALVLLAAAIVVIVVLATRPPQVVVMNAEDLIRQADAIGFSPATSVGQGLVELAPASARLPDPSPDLLPVGTKAPDFQLKTVMGESVKLSSFRGKTVLLEFFATWCPHCQAEAPYVMKIFQALPPVGFEVIGINVDSEDPASVFAFDHYFGIPYRTLLDPGGRPGGYTRPGTPGPTTRAYKISILPAFYVIDPNGRVAWRADGERPTVQIVQELTKASGP
ncbi:MAG TPA: TlpA disulfide reductase family protein [Spirochaetia bacterium]|nr:TlpA disulfide reductase family protein [Spirochaetia bacterium]